MALGLLALIVAFLPAAPAAADVDWPDGLSKDQVRALTVGAASIASGGGHSCAITSTGETYCWGSDSDGQLGDGGGAEDSASAVAVRNASVIRIAVQVDAGDEHSCVLTFDGLAYCWGDNSSGQLGVGAGDDEHSPVRVEALADRTLVEVTTGANHSCAIDDEGAAWCWGDNSSGQLGIGGSANSAVPVRVNGSTGLTDPVVDISAGHDTTCAATADGVAWCWGAGADGQLGYGGAGDRDQPVRVSTSGALDDVRVRQVTVGHEQACALDDSGRASCWGRTAKGDAPTPAAAGGPRFRQIAAGGARVCGLDLAAAVWCWETGRAEPATVSTGKIRDLDVGTQQSCALDGRGIAVCWEAGAPARVQGLPRSPAAVTRVTATPLDGGLRISWRPVTDFGSGDFVSYLATTTDFDKACEVTEATGTGCAIEGLENGKPYDIAVLTYVSDGSALSDLVTAKPGRKKPPTLAPAPDNEGGGGLPITGPGPLVVLTIGLFLIALGLTALLVRKDEIRKP